MDSSAQTQALFDAVIQRDYDALAILFAAHARNAIAHLVSVRHRALPSEGTCEYSRAVQYTH
jgi:DNA-binding GntR family transcriptional regulator